MHLTHDVGEEYLLWARTLRTEEAAAREVLLRQLPNRIVDCHTHSSPAHVITGLSDYAWGQTRSSFPIWTAQQSVDQRAFLYGNRAVTRLVMAHPFRGFDHRATNEYLQATTGEPEKVILCGLPDDEGYTTDALASGRYSALKMYPAYREPPYAALSDYFPDWAMRAAAAAAVPVIVHLPLSLVACVDDVVALSNRFPQVPVVLAHLGRQVVASDGVVAAFEAVASCPRIYLDTSMATNPSVYDLVLSILGPLRVLYGSDEPFNLLRYVGFDHPTLGHRLMAPQRYHWIDPVMYEKYHPVAEHASLVHLQVLEAIISTVAAQSKQNASAALERIFHDNAVEVFSLTPDDGAASAS